MKYKIERSQVSRVACDALCVWLFEDENLEDRLCLIDKAFSTTLKGFCKNLAQSALDEGFKGKMGQQTSLPTYGNVKAKKVIFCGLGKIQSFSTNSARKQAANLARKIASNTGIQSLLLSLPLLDDGKKVRAKGKVSHTQGPPIEKLIQSVIEGFHLGSYTFSKYKSNGGDEKHKSPKTISISFYEAHLTEAAFKRACNVGAAIGEATNLARVLIAEPASFMTPTKLAEEAVRIAKQYGLTCKIMDYPQLEKLGMGALLGVARGAKEPAKFIVLSYNVPRAKRKLALVGKGITFDSGGLSLKTAQGMEHMKYDMSGAAAVIATMRVVGELKPKFSVMAIIGATENMPGDAALHPGDVLVAMNGKTIEVNNTDAEGRLILADALTYAAKQGATEIIDIATLTGAQVTALGRAAAAIMGSDQKLVNDLIDAGFQAGEKLWQLPLFDEYQDYLKSDIADLKNAGSRGEAGSSSAGMFLKEFVDGKPWAHLDIAGPAWLDKDRDECNKGGTGFGVRTLCHFVLLHKAD